MLMMDQAAEGNREELRRKLRENFDGRIVRKDLTKKIKEGANVPVYVLEFLLGQYCSSDDEEIIEQGVQNVKHILADNFVRPDEAQKVLSQLRRNGSHTIIDMVTVHLDIKKDSSLQSFPIWDSPMCPLRTTTRKNMTVCSAAASGASFNWNMNPKVTAALVWKTLIANPGRKNRRIFRLSASAN